MHLDNELRLKKISKDISRVKIIGSTGPILIGLAVYGIWGAGGDAFHPLLNDTDITYSMLGIGIAVIIWEFAKLIPLFKQGARLSSKDSA